MSNHKRVVACYDFVSVTEAFEGALNDCGSQDRIIVFGSFHTVGLVKQYLLEKLNDGN